MSAGPDGLPALLLPWLPTRRWYASTAAGLRGVSVRRAVPLGTSDEAECLHLLLDVADGPDGGEPSVYQLLLGLRRELPDRLEHALVGVLPDGRAAYDAVHDATLTALLVQGMVDGTDVGGVRLRAEEGADLLRPGAPSRLLGVEQSNTSLVFGEEVICKLFRHVQPGVNPDLEVTRALTAAGSAHVAPVQGWVETDLADAAGDVGGEPTTLAMAQTFLRTGSEGWALATASVRDLLVEADLHADEVGGDFAAEAERLGAATATVHAELAASLPTRTGDACDMEQEAAAMRTRLEQALARVPELAPYADGLRAAFDGVVEAVRRRGAGVPLQRVHGDLHLGQVLRTETGWFLLDFEGEPLKSPAERRAPASVLRDVAGMLRSFDYCAQSMLLDMPGSAPQLAYRAAEWAERNRGAFLDGYAATAGADPRDTATLLRAYELDKAVYEVVYEATHRPSWLRVPLGAVDRLTT